MQKNLALLILLISFIFTGCSSYSITKYFDKDEFYNKAIQYTKKSDIKYEENIKVMINSTYLNSVNNKYNNEKQNFIIGLYIVDDEKEQGLNHKEYTLLLNDKEPISIKKLKINDMLTQNIPLKNNWAQYYFVSFEKEIVEFTKEENHDLVLSYENIKERKIYLNQKAIEEEALENSSLLEELEKSTLTQKLKASVTFLKEL